MTCGLWREQPQMATRQSECNIFVTLMYIFTLVSTIFSLYKEHSSEESHCRVHSLVYTLSNVELSQTAEWLF